MDLSLIFRLTVSKWFFGMKIVQTTKHSKFEEFDSVVQTFTILKFIQHMHLPLRNGRDAHSNDAEEVERRGAHDGARAQVAAEKLVASQERGRMRSDGPDCQRRSLDDPQPCPSR